MRFQYGLLSLLVIGVAVLLHTYLDFLEESQTHYTVLGVSTAATKAEIRSAYRKMSLKYHPDKRNANSADLGEGTHGQRGAKNADEHFYKIVNAYETLSDDQKRRQYDRELQRQKQQSAELREHFRRRHTQPPPQHRTYKHDYPFTISWHLKHLLPMAHPSLSTWFYHLVSFIRLVLLLFSCFFLLLAFSATVLMKIAAPSQGTPYHMHTCPHLRGMLRWCCAAA